MTQVLGAYKRFSFPNGNAPKWIDDDIAGLSNYVYGLKRERSGDLVGALGTYQGALAYAGPNIPVDDIVNRIHALRPQVEAAQAATRQRQIDQRSAPAPHWAAPYSATAPGHRFAALTARRHSCPGFQPSTRYFQLHHDPRAGLRF